MKGHDFSRAASRQPKVAGALQAAEIPRVPPTLKGFVTGHDFSRADKADKMSRALAPEGCSCRVWHLTSPFPQPVPPLQNSSPGTTPHGGGGGFNPCKIPKKKRKKPVHAAKALNILEALELSRNLSIDLPPIGVFAVLHKAKFENHNRLRPETCPPRDSISCREIVRHSPAQIDEVHDSVT